MWHVPFHILSPTHRSVYTAAYDASLSSLWNADQQSRPPPDTSSIAHFSILYIRATKEDELERTSLFPFKSTGETQGRPRRINNMMILPLAFFFFFFFVHGTHGRERTTGP